MKIFKFNTSHIKIVCSIISGLFIAFFYLFKILNLGNFAINQLVFVVLYLFICFSVIDYLVIFLFALPKLQKSGYSERFQYIFLFVTILLGCYFYFAVPVKFIPTSKQELEIIANGGKNNHALGNEVRLISVIQGSSHPIGYDKFVKTGDWQETDGTLLTYPSPESTLLWATYDNQPITLTFISHPWSGTVRIIWNGHSQDVDLYNTENTNYVVALAPQKSNNGWLIACTVVSTGVTIGLIIFFLTTLLLEYSRENEQPAKLSSVPWWVYSVSMIIWWSINLLAFWPGIMSIDAQDQWQQFLNPQLLHNNLPVFHTLTMWAITRIWFSPAAIAFVQIIVLGVIVGWGFSLLRSIGTPRHILFIAWLIFTFSPVNSFFVITIEKDIFFSLCTLTLILITLKIFLSDGKWLAKRFSWISLGIILVLVALFRHNGFVIAASTALILLFVYRRNSWLLIKGSLLGIVFWIGVQFVLFPILNVKQWEDVYNNRIFVQQIIAHIKNNTPLNNKEKQLVKIISPRLGEWGYSCYTFNAIMYDSEYSPNWDEVENNSIRIKNLYFDLLLREPKVNITEFICRSSIIWRITQYPNGYTNYAPILFDQDSLPVYNQPVEGVNIPRQVVEMNSKLPFLTAKLSHFYMVSTKGLMNIWRPASYLYILIWVFIIVALRFNNWKFLCLLFPLIMHTLFLAFTISSQNVRYQYPIIVACLVLWPLLFSRKDNILEG